MTAPYKIQVGAGITMGSGIVLGASSDNAAVLASLVNNSNYVGAYNDIPGKTRPNTTRSFTVEAWVRWTTGATTHGTILGGLSDTARQPHFFTLYVADGSTVVTDDYFVDATQFDYSTGFTTNTWYHVAASRDASNDSTAVWVNGTRIELSTDSRVYDANSLTIGNGWPNAQDGRAFVGYQADLRVVSNQYIYNPASSSITVPTSPLTSPGSNCVALIQSNGSSITDHSPVGQSLTVANGMTANGLSPYASGGGSWYNSTGNGVIIMNPGVYNC
jgi:hypothetical protein